MAIRRQTVSEIDVLARLADITAVSARALLQDSLWITLSEGRGLSLQPGDIVMVQRRGAIQMLPVADAAVYRTQDRWVVSDQEIGQFGCSSRSLEIDIRFEATLSASSRCLRTASLS